jgi:hypothetical protein
LLAVAGPLGSRALSWAPPDGGWSIGQVLEHLVVAADSYLTPMRRLITDGPASKGAADDPLWRPSLMGGFLAKSLRSPRKLPAPRAYVPTLVPRANVLEEFRGRQRDTALLLDRARALYWNRIRLTSPVSRWIRLNLGDCFAITVAHARRHLGQIERIRERPEFPDI